MTSGLTESATDPEQRPYVGLVAFSERQARYLFGRDRERQAITANLIASRLTLLYGESGVGKTSVLRAGVVHQLRRRAATEIGQNRSPRFIVVEFGTWRGDVVAAMGEAIAESVRRLVELARSSGHDPAAIDRFAARLDEPPPSSPHLDETIAAWALRLDTYFLFLLDQFEEYFLYQRDSGGEGTFDEEFPRAVTNRDLRANFLVSVREDFYLKLDRFKSRIPKLFANALRIPHMSRAAAADAIRKPLEVYNRTLAAGAAPIEIEDELVERVLDESGQIVDRQAGQGTVTDAAPAETPVELPYLQLVMERIWDEERAAGSSRLRLATLERLGGAQEIWQTHLDKALSDLTNDERDVAARLFVHLVTPGGTKIAHTAADLAAMAEAPIGQVESLLEAMAGGSVRLLRTVADPSGGEPRYEIRHDRLAPAVLDWEARFQLLEERSSAEAKVRTARRKARLTVAAVVAASLGVVGVILGVVLFQQRQEADSRTAAADSRTAAAEAIDLLAIDPQDGLRRALEAWDTARTDEAEEAVRLAMAEAGQLTAVIFAHKEALTMAAFSPDGEWIVTASRDGTARIADSNTGKTLPPLRGHADEVTGARFSPDSRLVVTASLDGTAAVWDAVDGERLFTLDHDGAAVSLAASEAFDKEGDYIATGAFTDPEVSGGAYLVTSAGRSAFIWDLTSGDRVTTLGHGEPVRHAAFSADGGLVVTSSEDGITRIWDWAVDDSSPREFDNLTPYARMAVFDSTGDYVASANSDGSVGLWSVNDDTGPWFRVDHTYAVQTVAFQDSPPQPQNDADDRVLATLVSAGDKTAWVVSLREPVPDSADGSTEDQVPYLSADGVVRPHASWVSGTWLSPDGRYVATANFDGTARISDTVGLELVALRGHADIVSSAEFSPDGSRVVTASGDGTARVWQVFDFGNEVEDFGNEVELRGHTADVNSVSFSRDGRRLATAALDQSVSIWDAVSGGELNFFIGDEAAYGLYPMSSAVFDASGTAVLTAQASGQVAVWDWETGDQTGTCCRVARAIPRRAAFVPGAETRAAVFYDDGNVRIWDIDADIELYALGDGRIDAFALSADGAVLSTWGDDRRLRLWDVETATESDSWSVVGRVLVMEFSPDGSRLATAGPGIIKIWDVATGEELLTLAGNTSAIGAVSFSSDGAWLISGSADGRIRIWDARDGALLAVMRKHADSVNDIDVAADGRIASASDDWTARIYRCMACGPIEEVVEEARTQVRVDEPSDDAALSDVPSTP